MTTAATETPVDTFTAVDRCDQCGAQAYLEVEVHGSDLKFCKHHGDFNLPKMKEQGAVVVRDARAFVPA